MITIESYFMGRIEKYPVTPEQIMNAGDLLARVNWMFGRLNIFGKVSSGYRPEEINRQQGGAALSSHLACKAVDISDQYGKISALLFQRQELLISSGLYMESPLYTRKNVNNEIISWCHLQTKETKSRVFVPY